LPNILIAVAITALLSFSISSQPYGAPLQWVGHPVSSLIE